MSGFCVTVDFSGRPADPAALLAMASAASRRGPGGRAHRITGEAGLCHLALDATPEALSERQPVRCLEGSIHLVADVRLDNRRELIDRLAAEGTLTRDRPGDAELLLAAYRRWGMTCAEHLLGDFAFVLWDARRRQIFAACDPMAIKPLYYGQIGSVLCLASEAKQVLRHPGVSRRLDEIAVGDYLVDGASDPSRTLFRDVQRLAPGHRLVASGGGVRAGRFWTLDPDIRTLYRRDEDYAAHFLELFRHAVNDRLRTQAGSVGVLMSGGLDSTSVAAMANQCLPKDGSLRLFATSFVFERLQECDERPFIQAVAAGLGMETELVEAERFPVFSDPETCRPSLEAPSIAWDGCLHEALRRARNRGARVLLTGHGGDDLMTGSPLVYADRLRRGDLGALVEIVRHAAAQRRGWRWILYHYLVQPFLSPAGDQAIRRLLGHAPSPKLPGWIDTGFARRTDLAARLEAPRPRDAGEAARQALQDHFLQTPWDRAAIWYDQHAAAYGIEVRHPFLDRRLMEFLWSIPPERVFKAGSLKPLLRQAMDGLLPDVVRLRIDKTRLGGFLDLSLGEERREQIERWLAAPLAAELGFFDGGRLRAAYKGYQDGIQSRSDRLLWYSIALEAWLREHETNLGLDSLSLASPPAA
ncbi:MAG TPA: asparagine synthase-related protein [Thermoanaerobaculia bacterium]|nr:asparagine synthase-related protein [Thermoanaerobaculia bacterium]